MSRDAEGADAEPHVHRTPRSCRRSRSGESRQLRLASVLALLRQLGKAARRQHRGWPLPCSLMFTASSVLPLKGKVV